MGFMGGLATDVGGLTVQIAINPHNAMTGDGSCLDERKDCCFADPTSWYSKQRSEVPAVLNTNYDWKVDKTVASADKLIASAKDYCIAY